MKPSVALLSALVAAIWAVANALLVNELSAAAFVLLSLVGVCSDAHIQLCNVVVFVGPATVMALGFVASSAVAERVLSAQRLAPPRFLTSTVLLSGLAFVVGALCTSLVVFRAAPPLVPGARSMDRPLREVAAWFPAIFASVVVLARALRAGRR